jgi:hypothetical protein
MIKKYPEYFVDGKRFAIWEDFNQNSSYDEDLKKAKQYAKKVGGEIYTEVDTGGTSVGYLKGIHFVNRLGYSVVKLPKIKEKRKVVKV